MLKISLKIMPVIFFIGIIFIYICLNKPNNCDSAQNIIIPKGASFYKISDILSEHKIVNSKKAFIFYGKVYGLLFTKLNNIKAGEYIFPEQINLKQALKILLDGEVLLRKVTIPEGLTLYETLKIIDSAYGLSGNLDTSNLKEGSLYPETYTYTYGDEKQSIILQMSSLMMKKINDLWINRQPGLPLKNKEEALILASIVEKESSVKSEGPIIASVFINRLKKGMRLQSDPTVIYALSEGKGKLERLLLRKDLQIDNPFNTYFYSGLPPQAICSPSEKSIKSVLNPEDTDYFYFVANGNGGHVFAKTLEEHNKNVASWRKINKNKKP